MLHIKIKTSHIKITHQNPYLSKKAQRNWRNKTILGRSLNKQSSRKRINNIIIRKHIILLQIRRKTRKWFIRISLYRNNIKRPFKKSGNKNDSKKHFKRQFRNIHKKRNQHLQILRSPKHMQISRNIHG